MAALDVSDGTAIADWDPEMNGYVRALLPTDDAIYAGGDLTSPKYCLAGLDPETGDPVGF